MLHKTRGKNNGGASPLVNIGYNNVVMKDRIVAIISPNSAPVKRLKEEAGKRMKLVDATQGRRTRAIIITDSEHVVLSAVALETIIQRFNNDEETATA